MSAAALKKSAIAERKSPSVTGDTEVTKVGRKLTAIVSPAPGPNLTAEDQAIAEKRFSILEPLISPQKFQSFWLQCGNSKVTATKVIAERNGIKKSTVYRWLDAYRSGGLQALVNRDRADKGTLKALNEAAMEFIAACALKTNGTNSVRDIFRLYEDEREWRDKHIGRSLPESHLQKYGRYLDQDDRLLAKARLPKVSYSSVVRCFEKIRNDVKVMARYGEEAFHNSQEIISFRNLADIRPLDYVVMDHRRLDLFCMVWRGYRKDGGWSLVRPWLTAAIDMRTRKWLAWAIVETPSSDSIATVLKRSFLEHGLPVSVYWDNGKDFRCEWLEGRSLRVESRRVEQLETGFRGVMDTLGIRVHHAIVKRARSKIIEPNFGRTADFDRTLPWWCGHQPAARPAERFDKLQQQHERWLEGANVEPAFPTIEQVAAIYDGALEELNERPLDGAEGMSKVTPSSRMGWMCPNEAWERLIGRVEKRTVPAEVLHFCFRKRREITIRHSEVKMTYSGKAFHYRLRDKPAVLAALNGRTVDVAYDHLDLETVALYYEGSLLGLADNVELRRMGEQAFVVDERDRRAHRREVKRVIEAIHSEVPVPSAEDRILRRMAVAPERREPQRAVVSCALPGEIATAAEALRESRAAVEPIQIEVVKASSPGTDNDEFSFFEK